ACARADPPPTRGASPVSAPADMTSTGPAAGATAADTSGATHGSAARHRSAANRRAAAGVSPAVPTRAAAPADPAHGIFPAHVPAWAVPTVVVPAIALAVVGVLRLVRDLDGAERSAQARRIGERRGRHLVGRQSGKRNGGRRHHRPPRSCHNSPPFHVVIAPHLKPQSTPWSCS